MREFTDLLLSRLEQHALEARACVEAIERATLEVSERGDLQAACNEIARMQSSLRQVGEGREHLLEMLRGVGFVPV